MIQFSSTTSPGKIFIDVFRFWNIAYVETCDDAHMYHHLGELNQEELSSLGFENVSHYLDVPDDDTYFKLVSLKILGCDRN
jgi:hypothetical protein